MQINSMEQFKLIDEDYYVIEIAKSTARRLLSNPKIAPKQIVGLGNALYALERLPLVTVGSHSEFGIVYRAGSEELSETKYISFSISESAVEISIGGSVNQGAGSDSFSEPGWMIKIDGYRNTECELHNIEDEIAEYLNMGAEITVHDESEIEYE
jgi:hypothetical protein